VLLAMTPSAEAWVESKVRNSNIHCVGAIGGANDAYMLCGKRFVLANLVPADFASLPTDYRRNDYFCRGCLWRAHERGIKP
jgi:hypothetical protein